MILLYRLVNNDIGVDFTDFFTVMMAHGQGSYSKCVTTYNYTQNCKYV